MELKISFSERFRDRPYHFAGYLSYAYFDCRKIDLIANKVSEFAYDESEKLEKLYATNKETFYRKLFKRHRPADIIQEFNYYLPHLPLKSDRKPIFDELETLFKRKSWIGFYSLALTQIEGLFSEMYIVLNPEAESNWKALPDKVQYARRFHDLSTYYFDYYQYQIPRLRNKFIHYGYDEDFKIKSFDVLFDLRHLLKMFMELNNLLVKIKQLHVKRKFENFITYTDYADYFQLLNELTPKQKKEIDGDIKSFEKEFLITYCNAEYVCLEVAQGLPQEIDEFLIECNRRISDKGKLFDFSDI